MPEFIPVTEHVYRLEVGWRLFGLATIPVAVWLIREREGWTLVDAGPPEAADQVVAAVARATGGRGPGRILLTHAHYDHGGALESLRTAWNPAILCHAEEVPFVTGAEDHARLKPHSLAFWFGRFVMVQGDWELPVARDLERGQSAVGMAVIHLPGHTPGHVGFLHPADHAMICGDAVMNLRGRLGPPPAISTPDPKLANASIERLAELDFLHLLPSHGPVILDRGRQALLDFLHARDKGPGIRHW
jgi:glyoxylase-like metal-dependent hydrolase (beta-lactamase superfamily II)